MMRFVPLSSWQEPLNWDLQASYDGELYTPFHYYVRSDPVKQHLSTFSMFSLLPVELQLRIVHFCDVATLYQLMRASPSLRSEAKKLFWSNSGAWYFIPGSWLLAGGYAGHAEHDTRAIVDMKRVEVDFDVTGPLDHNLWDDGRQQFARRPTGSACDQQIQSFWQIFQRRLPYVTHVVLSQTTSDEAGTPAPEGLTMVAEGCPAGVQISISCTQQVIGHSNRLTRTLWQLDHATNDKGMVWGIVNPKWSRQRVLPPPKEFRGPVGKFCRIQYLQLYKRRLHRAGWILLTQAMEGYYFTLRKRCICPSPQCDLQFELPGQLAAHLVDTGHDFEVEPPIDHIKAWFRNHSARLADIQQQWEDITTSLRDEWGQENSEQRQNAEQIFLHQLQHDPLYTHQKLPHESSVWARYQREMNEEEDFGYD